MLRCALLGGLYLLAACGGEPGLLSGPGTLADLSDLDAPQLVSISPKLGPSNGGVELSISGTSFSPGATVTIDGVAATDVSVWSGTLITATLPARPGALGNVPVVVRNADGKLASREDLFGYYVGQLPFPNSLISSPNFDYESWLAVGEFNGDGTSDIVAIRTGSQTVAGSLRVFLSNGVGGYERTIDFAPGINPIALTLGDWNGDKHQDIVVANNGSDNVSLYLGDGHGNFQGNKFAAGAGPTALVSGDWNGDGKLDLAVANGRGPGVSVLMGNGLGGFGAPVSLATGASPSALLAADWNGDGRLDLAVANKASNDVSILLGTATGSFAGAMNFAVGLLPLAMTTADFDQDGRLDLTTLNEGSKSLTLLRGDGAGGFTASASVVLSALPATIDSVVVESFDRNLDGKTDIVIRFTGRNPNGSINGGYDLLNDGTGTFKATLTGILGVSTVSGDFNSDGRLDLATCGLQAGIILLISDEFGKTTRPTFLRNSSSASEVPPMAAADFNGDGNPDLVLGDVAGTSVSFGDGKGGISSTTILASRGWFAAGDFNGDHLQDLAFSGGDVLLGDGRGGFSAPLRSAFGKPGPVTVGDFNGDGLQDLASVDSVTAGGTGLFVFLGDGTGRFSKGYSDTAAGVWFAVAVGDFNGDKKQDIAICGIQVRIYLGDGTGGFAAPWIGFARTATGLAVSDFNEDGYMDLAVSNYSSAGTVVFGAKNGNFQTLGIGGGANWVAAADFNGDQNQDLFLGAVVYWGDGKGGFGSPTGVRLDQLMGLVVDFNKDRKPDLVLSTEPFGGRVFFAPNSAK